jgi:Mg/Co/Ni transporter MgtE
VLQAVLELRRSYIKEVFVAQDTERLKDLMVENVISLDKDATMKQAADVFLRYGLTA